MLLRSVFLTLSVWLLAVGTPVQAQNDGGATGVFVAPVKLASFSDDIEALGTLTSIQNVTLASTVTELVTAVHFRDGQRVKQGELLVEMDASEELAELAEEQALVEEARRQVNRFEPLAGRGAASEAALDESRRLLKTAQARVQAVEARIAQRKVVAPFDGVVGLRQISVGALAQPGAMITTIDDDSVMQLDFSVPELFLRTLVPGLKISATAAAFPGQSYDGELTSVDSRVDPITRAITARALIQNESRQLKPGLLMRVTLRNNPRQTLVVQEEAIIHNADKAFVLVAIPEGEAHRAERREVKLGVRREGEVEVLDGVAADELVVVHGTMTARDGGLLAIQAIESKGETLKQMLEATPSQDAS
ncbi:MexH family multidrug efflux RND transporter periplasmic adaptor subunit [Arenicella chitinivorans]|uniref:MexH family multidrug efflux RND transporter periplasmic adaptor subunit n=1 Tax=Arenicella chitinivorans TaxID=1329800 RepID=A0A918RIT3_9GAMM|nr:efflux RND transporter periplasmic adaptor subunit [Arenicella chitinivorans]GGZ98174.1 MexH family multidrug efflux RND transporter periplasmic adaptor subunit [Arenicella chitinivorans]